MRVMLLFNWTKSIYIGSELAESIDFNTQLQFIPAFEIAFTYLIPLSANVTTFASDFSDLIDKIIDTKVRIIVTLYQSEEINFKLFEALYERGFDPGDYIPIYDGQFTDISGLSEKYPTNFEEIM